MIDRTPQVVAIIESIGRISGISTSILGLTVIAIGNSIGDLVADTAAAKGADVRMAVSAWPSEVAQHRGSASRAHHRCLQGPAGLV